MQYRILIPLLALILSQSARAQSYDAEADYSPILNPNGPWKFGYSQSVVGDVSLLPNHVYDASGLDIWWRGTGGNSNYPGIVHNPTNFPIQFGIGGNSLIYPGWLILQPGRLETNAVMRWTCPAAGSWSVTATWRGNSNDCSSVSSTANVHLLVNSVVYFSGNINGYGTTAATQQTFDLQVGDRVDVVVGNGPDDNISCDHIRTTFVITPGSCTTVTGQPDSGMACRQGSHTLSFGVNSGQSLGYQWRRNNAELQGETGPSLVIQSPSGADQGVYDCIATAACGSVTSDPATLTVFVADINADGSVNTVDLTAVLSRFGQSVTPWGTGDLNGDGLVNTSDLTTLLGKFGQTCP